MSERTVMESNRWNAGSFDSSLLGDRERNLMENRSRIDTSPKESHSRTT